MVAPSAAVEVFVDIYEPDKWADALATSFTDETKGMKHNLKGMGYDGDILIRKQGDEEVTWGIERKTFTDALNSWMGKRLIRQLVDLSDKVTHPILIVIEEPEKRLSSSQNNPYRKFAKHIPNLESHLNRISLEICPVIRAKDEPTALKEVSKLIERIENDNYSTIRLHHHKISNPDPIIEFLQSIPRVGVQRAQKIREAFTSFQNLLGDPDNKLKEVVGGKQDYEIIRNFLDETWK